MNPFVSEVTLAEIEAIRSTDLRDQVEELVAPYPVLPSALEARELARRYLHLRHIPEPDALHIAIASLEGIDFLLTWNLRHLVKSGTQAIVRSVNMSMGLAVPEIVTPRDFFEEG